MTALLFALGLLPLSADNFDQTHYVPIKVYHFKSPSPELDEAKQRAELIALLAKSIEESANHKTNYATEKRIQHLLRSLMRKEKK